MRYIILLLVLIGCSKTSVQPDITGHWIGTSGTDSPTVFTFDIVISKSGNTYNVTGNYSITGMVVTASSEYPISVINKPITQSVMTKEIQDQIWMMSLNNGGIALNQITASANFNTLNLRVAANGADFPGSTYGTNPFSLIRK